MRGLLREEGEEVRYNYIGESESQRYNYCRLLRSWLSLLPVSWVVWPPLSPELPELHVVCRLTVLKMKRQNI